MSDEETANYSIGVNVIVQSCTDDLNKLLQIINPIARDMPWKYWYNIMQSGSHIITCFDDEKNRVIGMTTVVPNIRPSGCFADICDIAVLDEYADKQIISTVLVAADKIVKERGLTLV